MHFSFVANTIIVSDRIYKIETSIFLTLIQYMSENAKLLQQYCIDCTLSIADTNHLRVSFYCCESVKISFLPWQLGGKDALMAFKQHC